MTDADYLAQAAALAVSVRGRARPNPPVGCVLVRDGEVVGTGATAEVGGPHAEARALAHAGAEAAGATAYVTLEPCAHHGRTPPCADALRAAGVRRVLFIAPDPNPVAAGGAQRLRAAGVVVDGPLGPGEVVRQAVDDTMDGFLRAVIGRRPYVTLKVATTQSGALTTPQRRWLTGESARRAVHRLRAEADAVLVGAGTVLADDPRLDVRHVAATVQPRPVVFDSALSLPISAQVVREGTVVCTTVRAAADKRQQLRHRGVEVIEVAATHEGQVGIDAALAALAERGLQRILAEPGARLAAALLSAGAVDRMVRHVALDLPATTPTGPTVAKKWRTVRIGGAGKDLIVEQVPAAKAH